MKLAAIGLVALLMLSLGIVEAAPTAKFYMCGSMVCASSSFGNLISTACWLTGIVFALYGLTKLTGDWRNKKPKRKSLVFLAIAAALIIFPYVQTNYISPQDSGLSCCKGMRCCPCAECVFKDAANKGDPDAQFNYGSSFSTYSRFTDAEKWFLKAAEQGHIQAMFNLGEYYTKGVGGYSNKDRILKDAEAAHYWYSRAGKDVGQAQDSALNLEEGLSPQQLAHNLSRLQAAPQNALTNGLSCGGVIRTDDEYARIQAERGDAEFQYYVGASKAYDRSGNRTYGDDAAHWVKKAADQGNIKAAGWLCKRFARAAALSPKLTPDPDGLSWCLKAANHGHRGAQGSLAYLYMKGQYVPQNDQEGYFWGLVAGMHISNLQDAKSRLGEAKAIDVERKANAWKAVSVQESIPGEDHHDESIVKKSMPLNIPGLICGGESQLCGVKYTCGELLAIECWKGSKIYFAKASTKEVFHTCNSDIEIRCADEGHIPKEWTCGWPKY